MKRMIDKAGDPVHELQRAVTTLAYAMGRSRVHERLTAAVGVRIERAETALLRVLRRSDRPLRITQLADLLLVQPPHVTRQVTSLESAGLVSRTRDAEDQRVQLVSITSQGSELIDRLDGAFHDKLTRVLKGVPPEEIRRAAIILEKIVESGEESSSQA
ncbi:MarR family transcriptional regulator [Streptomyces sp. NPDC005356]|uniref:MarR family winged helix-turn-helix transcriptional regulator n=1 Tax=Streptomyces sp. NPDC005356 TaxID=3157167 RepID=UPI0033B69A30